MDEDRQPIVGIISRLRNDFGLLLKIVRYAVFAFILIIFLGTIVLSLLVWRTSASLGDHVAEIGAIFAGMTLLLTMFAAVVAYIAFSVSFGFPDLNLQIRLGPSRSDQLTVVAERKNERLEAKDPTQTELAISFRNEGRHPAKELSAIIRLDGMEFVPDEPALNLAGWAVNERTETGITAVQWDGGADCTIPPGFIRELPTLNLSDLHTIPEGVTFMWLKRYSIRKYRKSIRSRRRPMVDKPPEALIVVSIWEAASRAVTWQPVHFMVEEKETS